MSDLKFEHGMKVRREVLGDAHVNRAEANKTPFDADFQHYITEMAWGSVWTRPNLERQTRHMITIAMMATLGKEHEVWRANLGMFTASPVLVLALLAPMACSLLPSTPLAPRVLCTCAFAQSQLVLL